ncbi:ladderlectin-like [Salvelinus alpinus]|uniref:ladderlectin-like n=1 Tax=Salvelinus alpinus TaxID=8036 RepID=UPI0039FD7BB5
MSLLLCWAVIALHLATGLDAASGVVNATEEEVEGVDSQSPCPAGWHQNEHRCFSFYPVWATWATAELYCSQHRGNLVSVHSPGQQVFVQDLVRRHTDQPVWIGGYDAAQEGMWLWSDGSAVDGFY